MCVGLGDQIQRGVVIAIAVDSSAARNGLLTDHQITEVSTQPFQCWRWRCRSSPATALLEFFFPTIFGAPGAGPSYSCMEGCIRGLHGDVFPSKDSNLSSLVMMGLREIYLMTLMLSFMCPDFRRFPFTWLNLTSPTAKSATTFLTVYTVQPSNNEYFLIV